MTRSSRILEVSGGVKTVPELTDDELAAREWVRVHPRSGESWVHVLRWWTTGRAVIGAVALLSREHGYWKAYIGSVWGIEIEESDEEASIRRIASWGTHFGEDVARVLAADQHITDQLEGLDFKAT